MKYLLLLGVILLNGACTKEKVPMSWSYIHLNGHNYIKFQQEDHGWLYSNTEIVLIHDPDCKCLDE